MICQFIAEADVAVRSPAQMKAVDPNIAGRHDAVELYEDPTMLHTRGQSEMLSIPTNSSRKKAARAARWVLLIKRAFNAPVVRHVQLSPLRVVETNTFRILRIRF